MAPTGKFVWNKAEEKRLLKDTDGPLGRHLSQLAARVESAAKAVCPVDTGRLRSSITWRLETESGSLVAYVGTNVEYAIFVHEGTRYMEGRPFLVDGLEAVTGSRGGYS